MASHRVFYNCGIHMRLYGKKCDAQQSCNPIVITKASQSNKAALCNGPQCDGQLT